jgi:beta-fructofuranosidase
MKILAQLLLMTGVAVVSTAAAEWKAHDDEAIRKADASVAEAASRVQKDSDRPAYHFLAPANWMNDPNGPIYHNGYYHMFYQHNPYGDGWGNMHWGHARSRDLMKWEHLPIALWPSKEAGEDHVFSGCATIRKDGRPLILYTSIGRGKSATDYAEQWVALGDKDLIRWEKPSGNPALEPSIHNGNTVWDWRDPFLFKYKKEDYLVLGGNLNHGKGGEAVVKLYKSKDELLMHREYLGVLFTHPDRKVVNIECPNFFELNGKWVLIISPHKRVEYFVGNFDGRKFTPEKNGLLDYSGNFYAPNSTTDDQGRRLLWGWVRGFKDGRGWNGCLTLPRVLEVSPEGMLWQRPAIEVTKLATNTIYKGEHVALNQPLKLQSKTDQFELKVSLLAGDHLGIRMTQPQRPEFGITFSDGEMKAGKEKFPVKLSAGEPLNLRIFVDHSVVELYANNSVAFTGVFQREKVSDEQEDATANIEIFSEAKNSIASVEAQGLKAP